MFVVKYLSVKAGTNQSASPRMLGVESHLSPSISKEEAHLCPFISFLLQLTSNLSEKVNNVSAR